MGWCSQASYIQAKIGPGGDYTEVFWRVQPMLRLLGIAFVVLAMGLAALIAAAVLFDDDVPNATAEELIGWCAADTRNPSHCEAYLMAVFASGKEVPGPGAPYRMRWPGRAVACVPDLQLEPFVEAVSKWLQEHLPVKGSVPAHRLVVRAFVELWPCSP